MLLEISTKANGLMIRLKDLEYSSQLMAPNIKVNGTMTRNQE